jgi:hypothetical protein
LKELNGKAVYKPVILNNTNAKFCRQEFKSDYMEHWLNKPFVLYAMPDKRHGFVARFKKYYAPAKVTDKHAIEVLNSSTTLEELQTNWNSLTPEEKNLTTVIDKKEEMKGKLQ